MEAAGCWVEARSDPPLLYPWSPYVNGDDECWMEGAVWSPDVHSNDRCCMEATASGLRRETRLGLQLSICLLFFAFGARVCIEIIATVEVYWRVKASTVCRAFNFGGRWMVVASNSRGTTSRPELQDHGCNLHLLDRIFLQLHSIYLQLSLYERLYRNCSFRRSYNRTRSLIGCHPSSISGSTRL